MALVWGGVCLSVLGCCSGVDGHHFIRRNGRSNWHQMGVCSCGDFIWGYIGGGIKCAHQITPTAIQAMMYVVSLGMLFGHYHHQTSLSVV